MSGYTDEDVANGVMAAGDRDECEHERSLRQSDIVIKCDLCDAAAILDAVAPAIVARAKAEALREAASLIYNGAPDPRQALYNQGARLWLDTLADEIEATR